MKTKHRKAAKHKREILRAAGPDMLAVLDELAESAEYWSDYDVPISIVDRINAARAKARGQDNAARAKARGQEYTPPDKADAMRWPCATATSPSTSNTCWLCAFPAALAAIRRPWQTAFASIGVRMGGAA